MIPLESAPLWEKLTEHGFEAVVALLIGTVIGYIWTEHLKRKSIVRKYREFIGYSAWALQERIYNIVQGRFSSFHKEDEKIRREDVYASNAVNYTVFLFCQFFAWQEIINREMYNFRFRWWNYDSKILRKQIAIEHWFSTSKDIKKDNSAENVFDNNMFMIFRGEQRVLGDLCVNFNEHTKVYECIGFSEFIDKKEVLKKFKTIGDCHLSLEKLENDVVKLLGTRYGELKKEKGKENCTDDYIRLVIIRNSLLDLLDKLDSRKRRHPEHRKYVAIESNKCDAYYRNKRKWLKYPSAAVNGIKDYVSKKYDAHYEQNRKRNCRECENDTALKYNEYKVIYPDYVKNRTRKKFRNKKSFFTCLLLIPYYSMNNIIYRIKYKKPES